MSDEEVDAAFEEFVKRKTKVFTGSLSDWLPILLSLLSSNVISRAESEQINAASTESQKAVKFWEILSKKGEKLSLIIEAFNPRNTTCSSVILNALLKYQETNLPGVKSANVSTVTAAASTTNNAGKKVSNDFVVSDMGAFRIKQILQNYPQLEHDWLGVPISLRLTGRARGNIQNSTGNFGSLVYTTLSFWREEKAQNAKFNDFLAIIDKDLNNKLAAEELEKNRDLIQNS